MLYWAGLHCKSLQTSLVCKNNNNIKEAAGGKIPGYSWWYKTENLIHLNPPNFQEAVEAGNGVGWGQKAVILKRVSAEREQSGSWC